MVRPLVSRATSLPGCDARAQSTAESVVTSPVWTPEGSSMRLRTRAAEEYGVAAAPVTASAPAAPPWRRVRRSKEVMRPRSSTQMAARWRSGEVSA